MKPIEFEAVTRDAFLSPCRTYRWWLRRYWSTAPLLAIVGLNPSTADATKDDPTIRRCVGFARSWGHGGIVMLNLFAFRSTDPIALLNAGDPVGPLNDGYLAQHTSERRVLCAWGARGGDRARVVAQNLRALGRELVCLHEGRIAATPALRARRHAARVVEALGTGRPFVIDKLDDEPPHGLANPHELLTLSIREIDEAIAALAASKFAPPRTYVVAGDGKVVVDP